MTTRHLRLAMVAMSATAALTLSACGGQSISDDGKGEEVAASDLKAEKAPELDPAADVLNGIKPDAELAKKVPSDIRKDGINYSTSMGYAPMEIWAEDKKTPIGVDLSLGRGIAAVLGLKLNFADEDFNSQIPGLLSGRYDMIMSSMSDTKERQKRVTFVDYVQAGSGFLVKKANPKNITKPEDMCGKTVSVVDNGSSLTWTEAQSKKCESDGKGKITILKFTGDQDAYLALKSGRADVNVTDYVVAASKEAEPKEGMKSFQLEGTESPWGIALNPDEKEFIDAVQGALQKLIDGGEYKKILGAYKMEGLAIDKATINAGTD